MLTSHPIIEDPDAEAGESDEAPGAQTYKAVASLQETAAFVSARSKAPLRSNAVRSRRVKQSRPEHSRRALVGLIILATFLAVITQSLLSLRQQGLASMASSFVTSLGKKFGGSDVDDQKMRLKAEKAYYKQIQRQKEEAKAAAKSLLWEVLNEKVVTLLNIQDSSTNLKAALRAVALEEGRLLEITTLNFPKAQNGVEGGGPAVPAIGEGVVPSASQLDGAQLPEQPQKSPAAEPLPPQDPKQQKRQVAQRQLKERERQADEQARLKRIESEKRDKEAQEVEDASERVLQAFQDLLVLESMADLEAAVQWEANILDDGVGGKELSDEDDEQEGEAFEFPSEDGIAARSLWASLLQIHLNPEQMAQRQINSNAVFEQLEGLLRRSWVSEAFEGGKAAVEDFQKAVTKLKQEGLGFADSRRVLAGKLVLEVQMAKHMLQIGNILKEVNGSLDKQTPGAGLAEAAMRKRLDPEGRLLHQSPMENQGSNAIPLEQAHLQETVRSMVWKIRAVSAQTKTLKYWLLNELLRDVCISVPRELRAPTARASFLLQRYYGLVAEGALYSLPYIFHSVEYLESHYPLAVSYMRFIKGDIVSTLAQLDEEIRLLSGAAKGPWRDWLPSTLRPLKSSMWFMTQPERVPP